MAKLHINDDVVTVVNTHLGVHMRERIKQNPILWSVLEKLEQPSILAGDFNMEMDDPFMKRLSSQWKKNHSSEQPAYHGKWHGD